MNSLPDRQLRSTRTLTQQALLLFEEKVEYYHNKLRDVRRNIDSISIQFKDDRPTDESTIGAMRTDLLCHSHIYDNLSREFESFLKGSRTVASIREEAAHRLVASTVRTKVDIILQEMGSRLAQGSPPRTSSASVKQSPLQSRGPSETGSSTITQRQAAKAGLQAARVALEFTEEEANLMKKQAAIEAERKVLESRRAVAVAQTTFEVLETLDRRKEPDILSQLSDGDDHHVAFKRTNSYVHNLENNPDDHKSLCSELDGVNGFRNLRHSTPHEKSVKDRVPISNLNPQAQTFSPLASTN